MSITTRSKRTRLLRTIALVIVLGGIGLSPWRSVTDADLFRASDPGVRGGPAGAGGPIAGLTARQLEFFQTGKDDFEEVETIEEGLGPRMNLDSCAGCHSQPATGGSSPAVNPQVAFASKDGGTDQVPFFIRPNGPIREARFQYNRDGSRDGGVHNTATITGRVGANGCVLAQPDFGAEAARNNLVFRIPTPVFGAGLIEAIADGAIAANLAASAGTKAQLGISGRANTNGNDGSISRLGWKAQNKSLLLFSGEAYNVEMGISNELFQSEREERAACQFAPVPNDITDTEVAGTPEGLNGVEKFAFFQRFLAPPTPSPSSPGGSASIGRGRTLFASVGCALCHTPSLTTGDSPVNALKSKPVNLFSDLALHAMGPGLADDILQGAARGDEFRTAPLWGLGKRIFFLHDGRARDLIEAIQAHRSAGNSRFGPSEANAVIDNYNDLNEFQKQDMLNFLRSL
jgi:CxxC motif-containing protein (DUF1111 family)